MHMQAVQRYLHCARQVLGDLATDVVFQTASVKALMPDAYADVEAKQLLGTWATRPFGALASAHSAEEFMDWANRLPKAMVLLAGALLFQFMEEVPEGQHLLQCADTIRTGPLWYFALRTNCRGSRMAACLQLLVQGLAAAAEPVVADDHRVACWLRNARAVAADWQRCRALLLNTTAPQEHPLWDIVSHGGADLLLGQYFRAVRKILGDIDAAPQDSTSLYRALLPGPCAAAACNVPRHALRVWFQEYRHQQDGALMALLADPPSQAAACEWLRSLQSPIALLLAWPLLARFIVPFDTAPLLHQQDLYRADRTVLNVEYLMQTLPPVRHVSRALTSLATVMSLGQLLVPPALRTHWEELYQRFRPYVDPVAGPGPLAEAPSGVHFSAYAAVLLQVLGEAGRPAALANFCGKVITAGVTPCLSDLVSFPWSQGARRLAAAALHEAPGASPHPHAVDMLICWAQGLPPAAWALCIRCFFLPLCTTGATFAGAGSSLHDLFFYSASPTARANGTWLHGLRDALWLHGRGADIAGAVATLLADATRTRTRGAEATPVDANYSHFVHRLHTLHRELQHARRLCIAEEEPNPIASADGAVQQTWRAYFGQVRALLTALDGDALNPYLFFAGPDLDVIRRQRSLQAWVKEFRHSSDRAAMALGSLTGVDADEFCAWARSLQTPVAQLLTWPLLYPFMMPTARPFPPAFPYNLQRFWKRGDTSRMPVPDQDLRSNWRALLTDVAVFEDVVMRRPGWVGIGRAARSLLAVLPVAEPGWLRMTSALAATADSVPTATEPAPVSELNDLERALSAAKGPTTVPVRRR